MNELSKVEEAMKAVDAAFVEPTKNYAAGPPRRPVVEHPATLVAWCKQLSDQQQEIVRRLDRISAFLGGAPPV
jgi:hypothetical protein